MKIFTPRFGGPMLVVLEQRAQERREALARERAAQPPYVSPEQRRIAHLASPQSPLRAPIYEGGITSTELLLALNEQVREQPETLYRSVPNGYDDVMRRLKYRTQESPAVDLSEFCSKYFLNQQKVVSFLQQWQADVGNVEEQSDPRVPAHATPSFITWFSFNNKGTKLVEGLKASQFQL